MANEQRAGRDWRPKESPLSALLQVLGVAVLLAIGVGLYVRHAHQRKDLADRVEEARLTARDDNPKALRAALEQLDRALEIDAEDAEALSLAASLQTELWLTHHEAESEASARALIARAAAVDAQTAERFATEALLAIASGDGSRAKDELSAMLERGATSPLLFYAAGHAYQEQAELKEASEHFRIAMEASGSQPRFALAYADSALRDGRLGPAAEVLEQSLTAHEGHLRSLLLAGLVGAYRGHVGDEARGLVKELLEQRRSELSHAMEADAHALAAHVALAGGDVEGALKEAAAGLTVDPQSVHAAAARAYVLTTKKSDEADAAWLQAAALRPSATFFYLQGSEALLRAERTDGARAVLDAWAKRFGPVRIPGEDGKQLEALDLEDRYWLGRARLAEATSQPEQALVDYQRALSAKGLHQADALVGLGRLQLSREEWDAALETLKQVAPEDGTGTFPEAYRAMGELLFRAGDFARGAAHFGYALGRLKAQGAPADEREALRAEVSERLVKLRQPQLSRVWLEESKQLL